MKTLEEQAREFAKRWCEENGRNSRHVRIQFAADFARAAAAPREELIAKLVGALKTARVGLFHEAPESCWATGPFTGDDYEDLVVCPGCRGIHAIDAAIAKAEARQ